MLKSALSGAEGMEVIGTAQNGNEGLKKIESLKPDVVTLDIEMPGLDGLGVLKQVMKSNPLPIVMVSTKTQEGAQATLDALQLGAVDYVAKPLREKSATLESFQAKIIKAVRAAAQANRAILSKSRAPIAPIGQVRGAAPDTVIAIGISAGGPATLHDMIPAIPKEFPPIVITQHMPADFTKVFAERLSQVAQIDVKEAATNDPLIFGRALIAPGNRHLRIRRQGKSLLAVLNDGPKVSGFRPSVDVLFESVAKTVGSRAVAVVMTGMGSDGSAGVGLIKKQGGVTIAQDKATSVVFGMPKCAAETGFIDQVVPLGGIPAAMAAAVQEMQVSRR